MFFLPGLIAWIFLPLRFLVIKPRFILGLVGHFELAVRNPKKSAEWCQVVLGLRKEFEFENGITVGNQNVTIVLFKGSHRHRRSSICHFTFQT